MGFLSLSASPVSSSEEMVVNSALLTLYTWQLWEKREEKYWYGHGSDGVLDIYLRDPEQIIYSLDSGVSAIAGK